MNTREARTIGSRLASLILCHEFQEAEKILSPTLSEPIPFRLLDHIGAPLGEIPAQTLAPFLDWIASTRAMGGWAVIGSALGRRISSELFETLGLTHEFIILSDVWYGTDILGERVLGPALVGRFEPVLEAIYSWRFDENHWVRRSVGVGVHFFAKRSKGSQGKLSEVQALLDFLAPMFSERDIHAIKGIGWGLKALGRYYPEIVAAWLIELICIQNRSYRALMLNKSLTYLPNAQSIRIQLSQCEKSGG